MKDRKRRSEFLIFGSPAIGEEEIAERLATRWPEWLEPARACVPRPRPRSSASSPCRCSPPRGREILPMSSRMCRR